MIWTRRNWLTLAAISALISVAVGAFAAHGVNDVQARDLLRTGAQYQFMHAIATIACSTFLDLKAMRARFAPAAFLSGSLLFSGSLYALACGAPRGFGAITPFGGLLFLTGWAVLIWAARQVDREPRTQARDKN